MLVITRHPGESVFIRLPDRKEGVWIQIKLIEIDPNRCSLGIQAPSDCTIIREELRDAWRDREPKAEDKEGHRAANSPKAGAREKDLPQIPGNSRGRTGSSLGPSQRTHPPFRKW